MDPVSALGIATGVIGLVPLCASGFAFIEGICQAHGGVQEQMVRIYMQRGVHIDLFTLRFTVAEDVFHRYSDVKAFLISSGAMYADFTPRSLGRDLGDSFR